MPTTTDSMGTLVAEVGNARVTRHFTMGQTWYMVTAPDREAQGWYSEDEALRCARSIGGE